MTSLYKFYSQHQRDTAFGNYYWETTQNCPIHKSARRMFECIFGSYDTFLNYPELFAEMKLTSLFESYRKYVKHNPVTSYYNRIIAMYILIQGINLELNYNYKGFILACKKISDSLDENNSHHTALTILDFYNCLDNILIKISQYTKDLCKCKVPYNCVLCDTERLDLVEKIIYQTEINDFFYFMNIMGRINLIRDDNIPPLNCFIKTYDEKMIMKILNHFQKEKSRRCWIYNNNFIVDYELRPHNDENIEIYCVEKPDYCFVCEKYDIETNYIINSNTYTKTEIEKNVLDFACKPCKLKIINDMNISLDKTINKLNYEYYISKQKIKNNLQMRRAKHIMIIMANLFDANSSFAIIPIDIIYHMIRSIYWDPLNAIPDPIFYTNKNEILLYSQFRGKIDL